MHCKVGTWIGKSIRLKMGPRKEVGDMLTETGHHSIHGERRMGNELVHLRDNVGWMEEEDRVTLGSKAVVVPTGDCTEDSRVWGVAEDWSNEDGRQTIGGHHSTHALWHVMSEGRL